ncbi:5'-AMP-activated protein kinase subunit beta-1-like [Tropilaelaps mercedesae]|uniref:5'-AMP-activated protein kinase subunit beta-1 n=1 Tax=Tropilaelaps mercedesae TaxID=418985 RepID=A0A1V9XUD6_9ACAR|nr:5'-AMP-activated protein kinase subunit beta-1-like [Tropilaelaps mercedesae]
MGNTSSGKRERAFSSEVPCSPGKEDRALEFNTRRFHGQNSLEENEEFLNSLRQSEDYMRPRASTVSDDKNGVLPTVFKWEKGGKDVSICGTFTQWKPIPMVKSHGDFVIILDVPEGEHEYRFKVDGHWHLDDTEPTVEAEEGQSKNNVIKVKQSDFEVFEALAVDSLATQSANAISRSPPGDYTQEIPTKFVQEPSPNGGEQQGPPILPPHLLQVILNKDIPLSCEPTLLPEPNHVMLNHLYALSIKDGVMVLSGTQRYRKKYVTTLLYKPI